MGAYCLLSFDTSTFSTVQFLALIYFLLCFTEHVVAGQVLKAIHRGQLSGGRSEKKELLLPETLTESFTLEVRTAQLQLSEFLFSPEALKICQNSWL